ncbi:MAG: leucine-rich repeat domain-containing protein, partial [Promethearchaeota archaeon]
QILKELEQLIGQSLPRVDKIDLETVGVQVEGDSVIGLGLYDCELTALPESFEQLKSLQTLDLTDNQLTALPESFSALKSLKILYLSDNQLTALPESFSNLKSLNWLSLKSNKLTALPESFSNLKSLQELDLSYNQLTALPEPFGQLKSLQKLNLERNKLTSLPESILKLKSLQKLGLGGNKLTILPEPILELKSLQTLELGSNQLTTLPESFSALKSLQDLDLGWNKLKTLPEPILELKSLQTLELGGNQLTALPESFWHLHNLKTLSLIHNSWEGEWKEIVNYSIPGLLAACRKRARITLYISYAREDQEQYRINNLVEDLKNREEIREVYMNGDENILECQLLLFLATRKSIESKDCRYELGVAVSQDKEIIPIKAQDIEWNDLVRIDLRQEGHGFLNLKKEQGFVFDGKNVKEFCNMLYEHIYKYKRLHNVFETREEKLNNLKRSSENIISRFIKSERIRMHMKENQMKFEEIFNKLDAGKIAIREFLIRFDQILTRRRE